MTDLRLSYRRYLARVRLVVRTVTELGLPTVGLVAVNSARRQVVAWRAAWAGGRSAVGLMPGRLDHVVSDATGARLVYEEAVLDVHFLAPDVVRLSWGPGPQPVPYAVADETPWPAPVVDTGALTDGGLVLRTAEMVVTVDGEGSVRILRPDGTVLRSEAPPVRRGAAWELRHSMRPGECFSGLGEQSAGVDLRGGRYGLWNTDAGGSWSSGQGPLYLGIPVVVATHRDGDSLTFYENSTHSVFSFGEGGAAGDVGPRRSAGRASVSFAGGVLRHYVMVGDTAHLLDRYTQLTGRPVLPPRWALGYHQSRWGYKNETDVRAVVDGYRALGTPLSAVHLDIDYMDGYRVFTFDRTRFPEPRALATEVAASGVRLVTIVDPGVKVDNGYDVYRQGLEGRRFCVDDKGDAVEGVVWPGRVVFPDFTDPGTRRWWAERYRFLTDAGIAGIWHDMNEPASISLLGDPSLPLSTRHDFDGRGGDHGEGHNLYGLLMNRAGYEGLTTAARPERRPFIVSRSGWAGMQRFAWNWTGDVASTWESMRQQMATVIGLGLSGVPFSGPDIGGFSGVPHDELYVRWLQMSVLLPYCRTHSVLGAPAREPWRFDEPARRIIVAWLRFRYRLLPYLYTLSHHASVSGAPLVRPLWWPDGDAGPAETRSDAIVTGRDEGEGARVGIDDAFLLGPALLVAPITAPGATSRHVTLPRGPWFSLWADDATGGPVDGESRLDADAGRTPVLVRAGSIVPFDDGWRGSGDPCRLDADTELDADTALDDHAEYGDHLLTGTDTGPAVTLELDHAPHLLSFHCWPTERGDALGTCFDDAGDGAGPGRRDTLRLTGAVPGGSAVLTWERQGEFPPPAVIRIVLHGFTSERANVDGEPVTATGSSLRCRPFSELRLDGIRPAPEVRS